MVENVAFAIDSVNSQCDISGRYTVRMNREKALRALIDERFNGRQADFARAIGRSPSLVWQWLNGHRSLGEKAARDIERRLRMLEGALDREKRAGFNLVSDDERPDGSREAHVEEIPLPEGSDFQAGLSASKSGRAKNVKDMFNGKYADELEFIGHMDAWDSKTPLDDDEVELPLFREVELAAGAGQTEVIENHGAKLRFAKSTLARAGVVKENAACAFVRGNSMEPVMPDGTCVGVNTGDTAIRDGEIYAIDHGGMLRVKYLHRRPGGGIKIVSQNAVEHPVEDVTADEMAASVRVIGRVFWWSVLR